MLGLNCFKSNVENLKRLTNSNRMTGILIIFKTIPLIYCTILIAYNDQVKKQYLVDTLLVNIVMLNF